MAEYSKLGYGAAADLDGAIEKGVIDGKDIVVTKDTSELYYIRDDKTKQAIRPRNVRFDTEEAAVEELNKSDDTYAGQTVMVKDGDGKYCPYIVQTGEDDKFTIEPTAKGGGFVWQEF